MPTAVVKSPDFCRRHVAGDESYRLFTRDKHDEATSDVTTIKYVRQTRRFNDTAHKSPHHCVPSYMNNTKTHACACAHEANLIYVYSKALHISFARHTKLKRYNVVMD